MDLSDKTFLRHTLTALGIRPRKALGQNFLIDRDVLEAMLETAAASQSDHVLEIGPGLGTMTEQLAKHAGRITAVEFDTTLVKFLRDRLPANVDVIEADIRHFDLSTLGDYKVVANLPYYLTSPILQQLLRADNKPASITVMIQREVAERITARPGDMSLLALAVQYFGAPQLERVVPRTSFYPAPEVDSAILQIVPHAHPIVDVAEEGLFRLARIGFSARRKMLKNNLASGLRRPADEVAANLIQAGLKPTARAQELSLADWTRLAKLV